jgi:hypothetical protein
MVTVRHSEANGAVPEVVDRRWVDLADPCESFVYHMAMGLDLPAAEPFVAGVVKRADDAATEAVGALRRTLGLEPGEALRAVVVGPEPPWDWPPLVDIVRSHTLVHTAEGHLYREVVWDGFNAAGSTVSAAPKKGLVDAAAAAMSIDPRALRQKLTDMGKPLGPPWRREQKDAALAAWWELVGR